MVDKAQQRYDLNGMDKGGDRQFPQVTLPVQKSIKLSDINLLTDFHISALLLLLSSSETIRCLAGGMFWCKKVQIDSIL